MSGGSFDYLCLKDLDDLIYNGFGDNWDHMLSELDELCPKAAREMRTIRTDTETFLDTHEPRWKQLQPLLKAIEWWRSGDYGKDQVDQAIIEYKGGE